MTSWLDGLLPLPCVLLLSNAPGIAGFWQAATLSVAVSMTARADMNTVVRVLSALHASMESAGARALSHALHFSGVNSP